MIDIDLVKEKLEQFLGESGTYRVLLGKSYEMFPIRVIAEYVGVSSTWFMRQLKIYGIPIKPHGGKREGKPPPIYFTIKEWGSLTIKQLAEKYKRTENYICIRANQLGYPHKWDMQWLKEMKNENS